MMSDIAASAAAAITFAVVNNNNNNKTETIRLTMETVCLFLYLKVVS